MKRSKKITIGALIICLIAAAAIGGTLSFLTDAEKVTNHFSVADLDITIDEPKWDDEKDGKDLEPGDTREKDPTISSVKSDSYMRVVMTIKDKNGSAIKDKNRLNLILSTIRYADPALSEDRSYKLSEITTYKTVNGDFDLVAEKSSSDDSPTGVYYYNYKKVFKKGDSVKLFTNVVIPSDWKEEQIKILDEYQIEIYAQAIQTDNFENSGKAFKALDAEIANGTLQSDYATTGGVTVK